jgi:prepilin-type N-terminal cleavage/methylation domain-containing protein
MTRKGFTLVELMIAIIILTTGILALAGTAGAITRMLSGGGRLGGSAVTAEGRFELLRATPCASLASGSAVEGPYTVAWTVTTSGYLRTIGLTVSYATGRGTRTDSYQTTISCVP